MQIVTDPLCGGSQAVGSGIVLLLLLLLHRVVTAQHLGELVGTGDDRGGVKATGLAGQALDRARDGHGGDDPP
jgi:hypothetical protein